MTRRKGLSITAFLTRKQKTTEAQGRLREREPIAIIDILSMQLSVLNI